VARSVTAEAAGCPLRAPNLGCQRRRLEPLSVTRPTTRSARPPLPWPQAPAPTSI
jgi:hypothetical protein